MNKIVKMGLKYLLMSIATAVIYGIINYWTRAVVDMKALVLCAFVLFVIYCVMALISPPLRKLLGYENKQ